MSPVRLFVVDETFGDPSSEFWPAALAPFGQSGDVQVAGWAGSAEEAFNRLEGLHFDVAVVDVDQTGYETGALLDRLLAEGDGTPVVVLSERVDRTNMTLAVSAGAHGCIGRDSPGDLYKTVTEIVRGGSPIQQDLADRPALVWELALELRRRLRTSKPSAADALKDSVTSQCPLNGRERGVLELVADGLSYKEIGQALVIAERTVKNYMASGLEKLGARGRAHAVRVALEAGWICNGNTETNPGLRAAA